MYQNNPLLEGSLAMTMAQKVKQGAMNPQQFTQATGKNFRDYYKRSLKQAVNAKYSKDLLNNKYSKDLSKLSVMRKGPRNNNIAKFNKATVNKQVQNSFMMPTGMIPLR